MKFTVDRTLLSEACTNVSRAVSSKSTLPALEGLLIHAENNLIKITGYDLEMGITTQLPAQVSRPGSLILNARLFCDIVRKLPEEQVMVDSDEKMMTQISSGNADFSILGIDAEEFPNLPAIENEENLLIQSNVLAAMIRQTVFAVAQTDVKPVLTGILFETENQFLKMVALDGYRLAMRKEPIEAEQKMKFIVPGKTVLEVLKLLNEEELDIQVLVGPKHIMFKIDEYYIISRLLDGTFIDYQSAIPSGEGTGVFVSSRAMINSVERISLLITDRLKSPVRCVFEDDMVKMSCVTTIGKANDQLAVKMEDGANIEIGFNNKYLLDALKACEVEDIKMELSGALSPMKIMPVQGDHFLFLVLPVRLKADG